jgi:hypothetical protein
MQSGVDVADFEHLVDAQQQAGSRRLGWVTRHQSICNVLQWGFAIGFCRLATTWKL